MRDAVKRRTGVCRAAPAGVLAGVLAGSLAVFAGCGGAGGDSPTPPAPTTPAPSAARVAAVRITANRTATLDERGSVGLAAQAQTAAGAAVPGVALTWISLDTAVARVSSTGDVSAVAPGTARVIVTAPSAASGVPLADTATLTVTALPVAAVALADSALPAGVAVGDTATLTAEPLAADGRALPPSAGRAVAWATSDASVATVSTAGLVTARGLGTAVVTAASGGRVATTTVRVVAHPLRFVLTFDAGVPDAVASAARAAARRWEHLVASGSGAAPDPAYPACEAVRALAPGQYPVQVHVVTFPAGSSEVGSESTGCNRTDYQPAGAEIRLDGSLAAATAADLAAALAAHELGHALNLGGWTYQQARPMVDDARTVFTGARAAAAWQGIGGTGFAPLQVGAPGPVAHWSRAGGLCRDLMNPVVGPTSAISAVTLGALQDLGWTVAPERAEPIARTSCG